MKKNKENLPGRVRHSSHGVVRFLNNLKLRTKMIIMCVVCVLIPVVATNLLFWNMMYDAEQERLELQMNDICTNTTKQLESLSQSLANMTATYYTNTNIYEFLNGRYSGAAEYFDAYYSTIEPMSTVYGNNTYINNISLYSDNDTLINGGGVSRISSVKDDDWYMSYKDSGRTSVVYAAYDESRSLKVISMIRKLDYAKSNFGRRERLVKFDLSYGYCSNMLIQQNSAADIYICDKERVLFSNSDRLSGEPFTPVSEINVSEAVRQFEYNMFGAKWQVYVFKSAESSELSFASIVADNWGLLIGLVIINMLLPALAICFISMSITGRLRVLAQHLDMVKEEQFREIQMPRSRDELGKLIQNYNLMTYKMRELIEDVYKERLRVQENELQKQRAELQALHSQINPHFMFNALESIRMRSLIKNENETAEIIELLAVMMRKSTDWGDDLVTIENEVNFAEAYLKLQQYRFSERLSYKIDVSPDCMKYSVPKLSIVTFIENACVHGVEGVRRNCIIILSVDRDDKQLHICVEDTGAGMSEERSAEIMQEMREATFDDLRTSKSIGIINACLRIKKCFGEDVTFEVDSEEGAGSIFTIGIPVDALSKDIL